MQSALARWLAEHRSQIEREAAAMAGRVDPASPEAEALRRFRSFVLLALSQGAASPALDGLRVSVRRAAGCVDAWVQAAAGIAGPDGAGVAGALAPLRAQFVAALSATAQARLASGAAAPSARRAVSAAIDRIADVYLAVDAESGAIADAKPAACAALGLSRPEVLARRIHELAPPEARTGWSALLDAMAEGAEPQRAALALRDASGSAAELDVRATRFTARGRTLALLLCRPPV
jgi:PAS domain-containing protein